MKEGSIAVVGPQGQIWKAEIGPEDADSSVSDWLERVGCLLNTRCGGRGLCSGCMIHIPSLTDVPVRACELLCRELPPDTLTIEVPEGSRRDQSLHGVSHFELRTKSSGPSREMSGLGVALDIGTTTVAGALWDFASGRCLSTGSRANAQARFGDNVVSRITASM